MLRNILKRLFPGRRYARKILDAARPPHFRSFRAPSPEPMRDLPLEKIREINEASRKYYEDPNRYEFWKNKPFSDPKWAPWFLARFGLLTSALRLRPGDRVLDFGCGTGWTSIMLAQLGAEVLALDVAETALKIGRENATRILSPEQQRNLRFDQFDGIRIPEPDGYFDFIVVFEAMHHLPNPETILREFSRVLHRHGQFGFAEPGLGHAETHSSVEETAHGILEEDLDLERFYKTGIANGFQDLDLIVPPVSPDHLMLPMNRARRFLRGWSWLLPADYIRSEILQAPLGLFRKSPYTITTLHPKEHRAILSTSQNSIVAAPGEDFTIEVKVENPTDTVWLKEGIRGRGYVRAGAHLLQHGEIVSLDYGRAELPRDLAQNEAAKIILNLRAPEQRGNYVIQLDLVNEGISWFESNVEVNFRVESD